MSSEQAAHALIDPAACKWLLDALPVDALYEAIRGLGREAGELLPGFSLSHRALGRSSVRALLARAVGTHPRLAERVLLARNAPWHRWADALFVLDEDFLLIHWRDLIRSHGPVVAVAMAMDERECIRDRGQRLLGRDSSWWKGRVPDGPISSHWINLVELLNEKRTPEQPAGEKPKNTSKQVNELEKQGAQLRESVERWKRKTAEAEAQLASQSEKHREATRHIRRQLREREEEIAHLHDEFEQRLRRQIDAFREELLGTPPEPPAQADPPGQTLAERAAQALERQNALDRQRGTRPQLHAELEQLETLEKRLRRCFETSLVLVPDLQQTATQVSQRLRAIREVLGEADFRTEAPDLADALFCRLKNAHLSADADTEIARLRDILQLDVVREVLGERVHSRLAEVERSRSELIAKRQLEKTVPATASVPVEPEVWNVAERLTCYPGATVRLFVDGYNAIRRVPDLDRMEQEQGMAATREHFCALCRRQAHLFSHLEIVFDGADTIAQAESNAAIRVVYSGSSGDSQNADDYLARRLQVARREPGVIWLVTDDFGLRDRVATLCDAYIPPVLFHRFLTVSTT